MDIVVKFELSISHRELMGNQTDAIIHLTGVRWYIIQ